MKFPKFPEDLVTFTEETLNGALHLLCSIILRNHHPSIETHLAVVRELPTKKCLPDCVNEKSSTERRS